MTRPKLVALMASEISGFAIAPREINKRPAEQTISAYPRIRERSITPARRADLRNPRDILWQTGGRQLKASQLARRHLRLGRSAIASAAGHLRARLTAPGGPAAV